MHCKEYVGWDKMYVVHISYAEDNKIKNLYNLEGLRNQFIHIPNISISGFEFLRFEFFRFILRSIFSLKVSWNYADCSNSSFFARVHDTKHFSEYNKKYCNVCTLLVNLKLTYGIQKMLLVIADIHVCFMSLGSH